MSRSLTVEAAGSHRSPAPLERLARSLVFRKLSGLSEGRLIVTDGDGTHEFGREDDPLTGTMRVVDPRVYRRLATRGTLGFAAAFEREEWTSPDLTALLRVFARNVARHRGPRWVHPAAAEWMARAWHRLRRNTRAGSRRNIHDHYDLGNEFFSLFLDPTMTYSSGVFPSPDATMEEASVEKLDRACRRLGLRPEHHLLEIGTGWGSLARHAASRYGCRVTTTTLSREQKRRAEAVIREAGLEGRVEILLCDYRDLDGRYDRIVSIEMIEAVGADHVPEFFRVCADRLRDGGAMFLQAITMADRDYPAYLGSTDFIQRFIFPGSCLVSMGSLTSAAARTDLRFHHVESIGRHYAETLRRWRSEFRRKRDDVLALGFDERFLRRWEYYLSYCEAGFDEDYVDDVQIVLARPGWTPPEGLA